MADYVSIHVLLLALRAYIGIQTRLVQCICAARRDYHRRRVFLRRKAALQLMPEQRSPVVWEQSPSDHCPLPCLSSLQVVVDDRLSQSSFAPGKRKRDSNEELLQYIERADKRFVQHSKDMNDALLQKMEADTSALLGLMGHLVAMMEAQSRQMTFHQPP